MGRLDYISDGVKQPGAVDPAVLGEGACAEAMRRIASLAGRRLRELVPALLIELDRLAALDLAPDHRLELLVRLKTLTRGVIAQLPKTSPAQPGASIGAPILTLEQRLLAMMVANLHRLLRDLDRPRYLHVAAWQGGRHWARANLMAFLGRQIQYAVSARRRPPDGVWQDLHDLFVYLMERGDLRIARPGPRGKALGESQFETAYKRLLLLGLVARLLPAPRLGRSLQGQLARWALDSWLIDPEKLIGRDGLILVEVARDAPPRLEPGTLDDPFRGWVLSPPRAFLDYLEHHIAVGQWPTSPPQLGRYDKASLAA